MQVSLLDLSDRFMRALCRGDAAVESGLIDRGVEVSTRGADRRLHLFRACCAR
jgi:hypothetical protein